MSKRNRINRHSKTIALARYDAAPGNGSASASPPRSVPRTQGRGGAVTMMASGTSSEVYETSGTGGAATGPMYATMPTSAALAARNDNGAASNDNYNRLANQGTVGTFAVFRPSCLLSPSPHSFSWFSDVAAM